MHPFYVSFFTPLYQDEAAGLVESLDRFGLEHEVVAMADRGGWQRNTREKAWLLGLTLFAHPRRPVVWLDADARVRAFPELFEIWAQREALKQLGHDLGPLPAPDFAAHWKPKPAPYGGTELLSGTLYFSGSKASIELVEDWRERCESHPDDYDQLSLENVVKEQSRLSVVDLPSSYTCIFDAEPSMGPPVICHYQASRRLKRSE
jgi:hypothetical protein